MEKARLKTEDRIYRDAIHAKPDNKWQTLAAMFLERGFANRIIRKHLNLPAYLDTMDRRILEQRIFPVYARDTCIRNVLFIGCSLYTAYYQRDHFWHTNYVTLDADTDKTRWGAKHHIAAPLEALREHLEPRSLDLVICNGVYGWGLDTFEQCEAAFKQCHECLVSGGQFLLGWDDVPARTPVPLEKLPSLAAFRKETFPGFGTWRYRSDTPFRHTFDFYRK